MTRLPGEKNSPAEADVVLDIPIEGMGPGRDASLALEQMMAT